MDERWREEGYRIGLKICLVLVLICSIACIVFSCFNCRIVKFDDKIRFYTNFTSDKMSDLILSNVIVLDDNNVSYTGKDLGLSIDFSVDYIYDIYIDIDKVVFKFNTDELRDNLEELNSSRVKSTYAVISKTNNKFEVSEDIKGNYINVDKLYNDIMEDLSNEPTLYSSYNLSNYYEEFNESECMHDTYEKYVSSVENFSIKYTNGVEFTYKNIFDYLIIDDNKIILDKNNEDLYNSVKSFVEENLSYYNTVGMERSFITTSGEEIILSSGTYGDTVDYDAETQFIIDSLNTLTSCENRLPEYSIDLPDFIEDTYIEVSIDDQHLWYYKDGELLMETDVVTGLKNKRDTPVGIYYISEKINGKYLTGDDYKTWVNKWMRLTTTGVGLHDAYWRGSFGGNIYTYNGSHGCINLPKSFAYELYDIVEKRTPVIIY